jgi:flagellar hook-basal body complex protein FliE
MSISPIKPITPGVEIARLEPMQHEPKVDLGTSFAEALHSASALEQTAQTQATKFAAGDETVGIHEVVIASEKANIARRYATTLKNKALEAYRELMGTQV